MSARITSWAETHISAAHKGANGGVHGHTWKIRAYWPDDGGDITRKQESLKEFCDAFDHDFLPDQFSRAEALAARVGEQLKAVRVDVWREAEGLGAIWTP